MSNETQEEQDVTSSFPPAPHVAITARSCNLFRYNKEQLYRINSKRKQGAVAWKTVVEKENKEQLLEMELFKKKTCSVCPHETEEKKTPWYCSTLPPELRWFGPWWSFCIVQDCFNILFLFWCFAFVLMLCFCFDVLLLAWCFAFVLMFCFCFDFVLIFLLLFWFFFYFGANCNV